MSKNKYAPRLPLQSDIDEKKILGISDPLENARQNLKMIILTNPGEKIMKPGFGIGIQKYLFETSSGVVKVQTDDNDIKTYMIEDFQQDLLVNISQQVAEYNPELEILDLETDTEEHVLKVTIRYSYKGFTEDSLIVAIGSEG